MSIRSVSYLDHYSFTNPQENPITIAWERGLFAPFEKALSVKRNGEENWLDRIKQIAKGIYPPGKEIDKLVCLLFAIAIDPDLNAQNKADCISTHLKNLNSNQLRDFHYSLSSLPPVMSISILRYCSLSHWQEAYHLIYNYYRTGYKVSKWQEANNLMYSYYRTGYEGPIYAWMKEISSDLFSKEEKDRCLDILFAAMSPSQGDDILFYSLNESDHVYYSPALMVRIQKLKERVQQFIDALPQEQKLTIRIPFNDNERLFFLKWFMQNLNAPYAIRVACELREEDWDMLHEHCPEIIPLSRKWILKILSSIDMMQIDWMQCHIFSSFFHDASSLSEAYPQDFVVELTSSLTPMRLYHFFDSFHEALSGEIIHEIVRTDPEKLFPWLQLIVGSHGNLLKVSVFFSKIQNYGFLQTVLAILFHEKSNSLFKLTLYSNMDPRWRTETLRHILLNETQGIELLSSWLMLCMRKEREPYLKDAFTKDLYVLLNEIDPSLPPKIKQRVSDIDLDLIFPMNVDLNDPAARQKLAIQKLKDHFLTAGISRDHRESFVKFLNSDIQNLPVIFEALPEKTWPLVFFYFRERFSQFTYFSGLESLGGFMYHRSQGEPVDPKWTSVAEWIDIAVKTLNQFYENPYIGEAGTLAMQAIYQTACETHTLHIIINRFAAISPKNQFMSTMDQFSKSCFYSNPKNFKELMTTVTEKSSLKAKL